MLADTKEYQLGSCMSCDCTACPCAEETKTFYGDAIDLGEKAEETDKRKSAGSCCALQAWLKLIQDSALLFDPGQQSVLSSLLLPCWIDGWSR